MKGSKSKSKGKSYGKSKGIGKGSSTTIQGTRWMLRWYPSDLVLYCPSSVSQSSLLFCSFQGRDKVGMTWLHLDYSFHQQLSPAPDPDTPPWRLLLAHSHRSLSIEHHLSQTKTSLGQSHCHCCRCWSCQWATHPVPSSPAGPLSSQNDL